MVCRFCLPPNLAAIKRLVSLVSRSSFVFHFLMKTFRSRLERVLLSLIVASFFCGLPELFSETPLAHLRNISARARVQTGADVLISGFIIDGSSPKDVLIRAIGPSLQVNAQPLAGRLADPMLELYSQGTSLPIATNDNWKDSQQGAIAATNLAPANDLEPAIVRSLAPGAYTTIVRGKGTSTGLGVVEVYELGNTSDPKLINLSARARTNSNDDVLIGGFIVGGNENNTSATRVIIRALGPSLAAQGVPGVLPDPTLQLFDANGTSIGFNDDYEDIPFSDFALNSFIPPAKTESVLVALLTPGSYTAIVRGKGQPAGVALVEFYDVGSF